MPTSAGASQAVSCTNDVANSNIASAGVSRKDKTGPLRGATAEDGVRVAICRVSRYRLEVFPVPELADLGPVSPGPARLSVSALLVRARSSLAYERR